MFESISLSKLVPSPRNVRKQQDPQADAELKASIAEFGLLQNLVVRPAAKGKFEVEAGERRRRALVALASDKALPQSHPVACLVLSKDSVSSAPSLAENFHRLKMNPADEAEAFAALVTEGVEVTEVARRCGLTVRFVEGRLRLAALAPVVFAALGAGDITLDLAMAFGATTDQAVQARVFDQIEGGFHAPSPDGVRRMVLSGTVRGNDPRARLVGRDAYLAAGGRIDRELFDTEESEAWSDVALLESLAVTTMDEQCAVLAAEHGLAWVKPTLNSYVDYGLTRDLIQLPSAAAPLSEAELARIEVLDQAYDDHAAIIEDPNSADEAVAAAEAAIEAIERETQELKARPPVLDPSLREGVGMIAVLCADGKPRLQQAFYAERPEADEDEDNVVELVSEAGDQAPRRSAFSRRLVDELAMQRRDLLALHVMSDPALALDFAVFTLADTDTPDWRRASATTLSGPVSYGPVAGFKTPDAPVSIALAELKAGLDESWRSSKDVAERFAAFRTLPDEVRAAWLGFVVGRTLVPSLNMTGERSVALHDHLAQLAGIETSRWWRPTAANYFDRVPKHVTLSALEAVGGAELAARFAAVKKADLAASAERVFAGTYITDAEVRDAALAWVPEPMRFADPASESGGNIDEAPLIAADAGAETGADPAEASDPEPPREQAA